MLWISAERHILLAFGQTNCRIPRATWCSKSLRLVSGMYG
jgi:hypothetical protein